MAESAAQTIEAINSAPLTDDFSVARVCGSGLRALQRNLALFLSLAVLTEIPIIGIAIVAPRYYIFPPSGAQIGAVVRFVEVWLASQLAGAAVLYLLHAAIVRAMAEEIAGRRPSFVDCIVPAVKDSPALATLAIVANFFCDWGLLLLILPGLYLATIWSMLVASRTIEQTGLIETFARSSDLTRGYRGPICALVFLLLVVPNAIGAAINMILVAIGSPFYASIVVVVAIGALIHAPVVSIYSALYFELRRIKDGADPGTLATVFD